ncbi:MAG: hypothetical protein ABJN40_05885 [Sneathiella sp.]
MENQTKFGVAEAFAITLIICVAIIGILEALEIVVDGQPITTITLIWKFLDSTFLQTLAIISTIIAGFIYLKIGKKNAIEVTVFEKAIGQKSWIRSMKSDFKSRSQYSAHIAATIDDMKHMPQEALKRIGNYLSGSTYFKYTWPQDTDYMGLLPEELEMLITKYGNFLIAIQNRLNKTYQSTDVAKDVLFTITRDLDYMNFMSSEIIMLIEEYSPRQ